MKNISKIFTRTSKKFICTIVLLSLTFLLFGCEKKEFNSDIMVKDCEIYSMNDTIGKKGLKTVIERTVTEKIKMCIRDSCRNGAFRKLNSINAIYF